MIWEFDLSQFLSEISQHCLYDVISYNDVISVLSSHEFGRNMRFVGL